MIQKLRRLPLFVTCLLVLMIPEVTRSQNNPPSTSDDYITHVKTFADNLLEYGRDKYGPHDTPMWASVIDVNSYSVPIRGVPPTQGVRPHDRAVGGSNYYHDVVMLKVFEALSALTDNPKYSQAAHQYSQSVLQHTQHEDTGLLGWGEHLHYNFYTDTVNVSEKRMIDFRPGFRMPHELIAWTPPWQRLWQANSHRTQKAIEGLKYHYQGSDPKVYLFNRHATWNKSEFQETIMPWIKHAALFSYSYAFLYDKTGNDQWKKMSRDSGLLYWNQRNYSTNLVFRCYFHSNNRKAGKRAHLGGTAFYAYWLYKAGELNGITTFKEAAPLLLKAYHQYGWEGDKNSYFYELNLDGSLPTDSELATPWQSGYGETSIFALGRVAAYIYSRGGDKDLLAIARHVAESVNTFELPDHFTAHNIGEAINFNMDLYDITEESQYLKQAHKYADIAMEYLWKDGFFVRTKDDRYYEAKLGIGDLAAGLVRLSIVENDSNVDIDWSF